MEFRIHRALQVAMLSKLQLEEVQRREKERFYFLSNGNIQDLFNLATIKQHYGVPAEDLQGQQSFAERVKETLKKNEIYMGKEEMENVHAFDWKVWYKKDLLDFKMPVTQTAIRRRRLQDLAELKTGTEN